jgi:Acetyltransferase (GNAT) domain
LARRLARGRALLPRVRRHGGALQLRVRSGGARLVPGVVLIARTIEDAIARGARRYDFLRGEEPYKYGFGARPVDVLGVRLSPAVGPDRKAE